jgi:DNA replication and repair protein RecF
VNRQVAKTRRDLADAVPVTIFSPEDLAIVQAGPGRRRDLLDDALALLDHRASATSDEVDRTLRQRGALLRQAAGRLTKEIESTLDVWDERLAVAGSALAEARSRLVTALLPRTVESYRVLAGGARGSEPVGVTYRPGWDGPLADALVRARPDDLRRAVSTVGPHRDDLELTVGGREAKTQASQGEQRCLALALRLGVHLLVTEKLGEPPILLLDDVFSELDPARSRALVVELPMGQALLTTAVPVPSGIPVATVIDVATVRTAPRQAASS